MKTGIWSALLTIGVAASSCGFHRQVVIDQPVGPPPDASASVAPPHGSDGTLVVYSSYDTGDTRMNDDASIPIHTPYDIFAADGQLVRHVWNRTGGPFVEAPEAVALPAGGYRVSAMAQEYGTVSVPVLIVSGKTTTVHLDSNGSGRASVPSGATVRLPDGQVVGWRAQQSDNR